MSTQLRYQLRCVDDLYTWLVEQGRWVEFGAADDQKPAKDGTVEAWGRSEDNPVGGWYDLRKGYRGRFGMYLPPLLEALDKVELTHEARNTRSALSRDFQEPDSGPTTTAALDCGLVLIKFPTNADFLTQNGRRSSSISDRCGVT
jgi:hypothetical protein